MLHASTGLSIVMAVPEGSSTVISGNLPSCSGAIVFAQHSSACTRFKHVFSPATTTRRVSP
eukprot:2389286-Rhodomonas_salina.3